MLAALLAGAVVLVVNQLLLQAREERLHQRVVPTIGATAHAACDPFFAPVPSVVLARLVAAAIRVRYQIRRVAATKSQRHLEGIDHQPAEKVDHHRQVQPTLARRDGAASATHEAFDSSASNSRSRSFSATECGWFESVVCRNFRFVFAPLAFDVT